MSLARWVLASFVAAFITCVVLIAFAGAQVYTTVCRVVVSNGTAVKAPCPHYGTRGITVTQTEPVSNDVVATHVTPAPTAAPTGGGNCSPLVNGQPFPAGCAPYSATSVWNKPLPAISPGFYTTDSATIVNAQFPAGHTTNWGEPLRDNEPGQYDAGRVMYYSSATDPLVNTACASFFTGCFPVPGQIPTQVRIPAKARGSQDDPIACGCDNRLEIVDMTGGPNNGTEYDFYSGNTIFQNGSHTIVNGGIDWTNGSTMPAGSTEDSCGNFFTGTGITDTTVPFGTTAGNQCSEAGLVTINDELTGTINHALIIVTNCTNPGGVAPARNQNTNNCTDGIGPKLGYRLWYDVPAATTQATTTCTGANGPNCLWLYEKAILKALNVYGAFVMDDYGGGTIGNGLGSGAWGAGFATEGSESFFAFATGDKWAALSAQGWFPLTITGTANDANGNVYRRWFAGDADSNGNWQMGSGINLQTHLHYLKSCLADGTC